MTDYSGALDLSGQGNPPAVETVIGDPRVVQTDNSGEVGQPLLSQDPNWTPEDDA